MCVTHICKESQKMRVTFYHFNWVENAFEEKMTESLILKCLIGVFSEGGT